MARFSEFVSESYTPSGFGDKQPPREKRRAFDTFRGSALSYYLYSVCARAVFSVCAHPVLSVAMACRRVCDKGILFNGGGVRAARWPLQPSSLHWRPFCVVAVVCGSVYSVVFVQRASPQLSGRSRRLAAAAGMCRAPSEKWCERRRVAGMRV